MTTPIAIYSLLTIMPNWPLSGHKHNLIPDIWSIVTPCLPDNLLIKTLDQTDHWWITLEWTTSKSITIDLIWTWWPQHDFPSDPIGNCCSTITRIGIIMQLFNMTYKRALCNQCSHFSSVSSLLPFSWKGILVLVLLQIDQVSSVNRFIRTYVRTHFENIVDNYLCQEK